MYKRMVIGVSAGLLLLSFWSAGNTANLMPNPGAEEIMPSSKFPEELKDPRCTMGEYVPAKGWGVNNSSGFSLWGVTDKEAHSGKYSAFLTVKGSNERGITNLELCLGGQTNGRIGKYAIDAQPETVYYFSFWIKGSVSSVYAKWLGWKDPVDSGGGGNTEWRETSLRPLLPVTNEWQKYEGVFSTSKDTKKFVLRIQIPHTIFPRPGDTIYVDDVEIIPSDEKFN